MSDAWPPERVAQAADLWSRGMSASQIGARLGCSRNAVLGLRHRNKAQFAARREAPTPAKLEELAEARRHGRVRAKAPARVSKPAPERAAPAPPKSDEARAEEAVLKAVFERPIEVRRDLSAHLYPGSSPVAFASLEPGQCRFPLLAFEEKAGAASPFCGRAGSETSPAGSYCDFHHRIVWRMR